MIRIVDYDPRWASLFGREASRISEALGDAMVALHHIGSTAICTTRAKPIIDMLLEVVSLDALDRKTSAFEALGYEALGEFGIAGRRYFRRDDSNGARTHQIHAFKAGVPDVTRHLAFRDYMRARRDIAREYGALKERLATAYPHDRAAYVDGKDAFVKQHERHALRWASSHLVATDPES